MAVCGLVMTNHDPSLSQAADKTAWLGGGADKHYSSKSVCQKKSEKNVVGVILTTR